MFCFPRCREAATYPPERHSAASDLGEDLVEVGCFYASQRSPPGGCSRWDAGRRKGTLGGVRLAARCRARWRRKEGTSAPKRSSTLTPIPTRRARRWRSGLGGMPPDWDAQGQGAEPLYQQKPKKGGLDGPKLGSTVSNPVFGDVWSEVSLLTNMMPFCPGRARLRSDA